MLSLFAESGLLFNANNADIREVRLEVSKVDTFPIAILKLFVNDSLSDSLVIYDIDTQLDSLVRISDTSYCYYYKEYRPENEDTPSINQLLLWEWKGKIHLPYVHMFDYRLILDEHYLGSDFYHYWSQFCRLEIEGPGEPKLIYTSSSELVEGNRIACEYVLDTIRLTYDTAKRIFYQDLYELGGEYYYVPAEGVSNENEVKYLYLDSTLVESIQVGYTHIVFLKGVWFTLIGADKKGLMPFVGLDSSSLTLK